MGFFEDLGKQAAKVANAAASKSAEVIEVGKIKLAIKTEESKIDDLYHSIGEAVYRQCAADGNVPDYVKDDCIEIFNRKQVIDELTAKIQNIKGENQSGEEWDEVVVEKPAQPATEETVTKTEFTISIKKEEEEKEEEKGKEEEEK